MAQAGEVELRCRVDGKVLETLCFLVRLEGAAPSPGQWRFRSSAALDCVAEFTSGGRWRHRAQCHLFASSTALARPTSR